MKRTTCVFAVMLVMTTATAAQVLTTRASADAKVKEPFDEVEQLLVRHLLAEGGAAIFKVKTRIMRGRVDLSLSPVPGNFESYEKAPDMEMSIINAPIGQFISATDGVSRWRQTPWGAATAGLGGGGNLFKEAAKVKGGFKFRNAFTASRLKGRVRVDGREMIVLAATRKGHKPMLMYFDAETYLLRKQEPDRAAGGWDDNPLKAIHIDSYATVDGVKLPALFRIVTKDFTLTFRVTEVKHNVKIDDRLFTSPGGK
ncbi:MAG TPA: hypothetical protein VF297_22610 [Pyrinomonadaceae bacterium]